MTNPNPNKNKNRPDYTPPTIPGNLSAFASTSMSQINLSWTQSTDNVGVQDYLIERCTGASCTNFAQIAVTSSTSYQDTTVSAGVTYRYQVRARDGSGNLSSYSAIAQATATANAPASPSSLYEGFGASTIGGQGQTVYTVTNRNPIGPGSLYDAVQVSNRNIVFHSTLSGTIPLTSKLKIRGSNITIDGLTAASPGITLANWGIQMDSSDPVHDVIIRGIRVRLESAPNDEASDNDCIGISYGTNIYNIVVDHCSLSGSPDEVVGLAVDIHDMTFSWNIFGGSQGGTLLGGGFTKNFLAHVRAKRLSIHHNLFISATDRNPWAVWGSPNDFSDSSVAPEITADVRNNFILVQNGGWGTKSSHGAKINSVNNYYATTPGGNINNALFACDASLPNPSSNAAVCAVPRGADGKAYVNGNVTATAPAVSIQAWNTEASPFPAPTVTTTDAVTAAQQVYDTAGVRPLDSKDTSLFVYIVRP